jgi:hypothetical protein
MKQIVDINWRKTEGKFDQQVKLLINGKIETIHLDNFSFNWRLSKDMFCIGYFQDGEYIECINNLLVGKGFERCKYCEDKVGFRSAFLFGGAPNDNAKKYLSQKHYVYLAYFEPGIIKVGTASSSRKELRLIEQDALMYMIIAQSDGFNIQNLEKAISSNFQIVEKVTLKQKLKSIEQRPNFENAQKLLLKYRDEILVNPIVIERFSSWFIKDTKIINLIDRLENIYFPKNANFESETEHVVGKFLGLRGRFLIIKNSNFEVMLDKKQLIGRLIEEEGIDFEYSIEEDKQLGFF